MNASSERLYDIGARPPKLPSRSAGQWIVTALSLACLSLLEFRVITVIHGGHLQSHLDTATGILTGHPIWKVFQNRLLGPGIVAGMTQLSHLPFSVCYRLFCFALICFTNGLCYLLFYRHAKHSGLACGYTAACAALFVFFQDTNCLYLWDYIDFVVMLVFAWMIMARGTAQWQIVALYAVELLNRESAQLLALWLVIDAVQFNRPDMSKRRVTIDFARLFTGLALGVAGFWWTAFIRDKLCIQQTGVRGLDQNSLLSGQWFTLPHTFRLMKDTSVLTPALILVLLGALAYFLWRGWSGLGPRAWKVATLIGAMVTANLCFAFILEIRVWFTILPLLLWLIYTAQSRAADGPDVLPANGGPAASRDNRWVRTEREALARS